MAMSRLEDFFVRSPLELMLLLNFLKIEFCFIYPKEGGERWCGVAIFRRCLMGLWFYRSLLLWDYTLADFTELRDPSEGLDARELTDLMELRDCNDLTSFALLILVDGSWLVLFLTMTGYFMVW